MTESEARTKWCPMVRVAQSFGSSRGDENHGVNRLNTFDCNCIGSQCAVWVEDSRAAAGLAATGHCGMIRK